MVTGSEGSKISNQTTPRSLRKYQNKIAKRLEKVNIVMFGGLWGIAAFV